MMALQTIAFLVLAGAFVLRVPRAFKYREARLTCIGTGVGALAMLTLGTIVPQNVLDAPLGGHNLLKLVQTSLAVIGVWLGAQAALALQPAGHRMRWYSLVAMLIAPAIPFFFIQRTEPTNVHFLDDNMRQLPTWIYATLYLIALNYVAFRLIVAFRQHQRVGAWLIKLGAAAIIVASIVEMVSITLELITPAEIEAIALLRPIFDLVFYPGVSGMTCGIVAYATARALRNWRISRMARQLERSGPYQGWDHGTRTPVQLEDLYLTTIAIRDLMVSGRKSLDPRQLRILNRAERIVARSLSDSLSEGQSTVTTYTGSVTT